MATKQEYDKDKNPGISGHLSSTQVVSVIGGPVPQAPQGQYCANLYCWQFCSHLGASLCTSCSLERQVYEERGLEVDIPGEQQGANFAAQEFWKFDEFKAEISARFPRQAHSLLQAWDSVVRIRGCGISKQTNRPTWWVGSGFLLRRPPQQVSFGGRNYFVNTRVALCVMTNRHVYNDSEAYNIRLWAEFDDGTQIPLDTTPTRVRMWSPNQQLDYVGLDLIPTSVNEERKLQQISPLFWEESARVHNVAATTPIVIIGHPRGAPKHGSLGEITNPFHVQNGLTYFEYSPSSSRPGNSGSPVFFIDPSQDLNGGFVCALHYCSGGGVAYVGGIADSVRAQFNSGARPLSQAEFDAMSKDRNLSFK